jgi:hypothetical protein
MRLYKKDQSTSTGSFLDSGDFSRSIKELQIFREKKVPSQLFSTVWIVFSAVVGGNKVPSRPHRKYRTELYDVHPVIVLSDTCKPESPSAT